jgi:hypothetical protein
VADRDAKGKFLKGNKVPHPGAGRPARGDIMPVLIAVTQEAYSGEDLVRMIRETYDKAMEADDARTALMVIKFVVEYAIGKPVQRTLTAQVDPNEIRELLKGNRDDGDDGRGVVEVEGEVVE